MDLDFADIVAFHQGNVAASRKQVLPVLTSFLSGETTPDDQPGNRSPLGQPTSTNESDFTAVVLDTPTTLLDTPTTLLDTPTTRQMAGLLL